MTQHAAEVQKLYGATMLNTIQSTLSTAWMLLGFDMNSVFVGDGMTAITVSRATSKVTSTEQVMQARKNNR